MEGRDERSRARQGEEGAVSREPRPCDCGRDHKTCACGYAREECECGTLSACVLTWDRALARGALDGAGHRPVRMGGCTYPGVVL